MTYIDCYLAPVPAANRAAYEKLAAISAEVVREHGADPRMQFDGQEPVFDGARLIAGGFLPMLDSTATR